MPIDTTKTGAAIAAHRQRMNLSQQGLAGLMNVTHQAVSKWEKGLALPDTETLLALAKLFGCSMETLLLGVLPEEPKEEKTVSAQPPAEPVAADELQNLDFSSLMNMLPFVSTKAADQLFCTYAENSKPDAEKLLALAPFVSTQVLTDYVTAHPLGKSSPEVVASLAPFLPTQAVDQLILDLDSSLPMHTVQMLMPFASSEVVDKLVLTQAGIKSGAAGQQSQNNSFGFSGHQIAERVHRDIAARLGRLHASAGREAPRSHLIRKIIETGHFELLEDRFDELSAEEHHRLLNQLKETGSAKLLDLFCEYAAELDETEQLDLMHLLIDGKMFGRLEDVLEELDGDIPPEIIDRMLESGVPELLQLIAEHIN